MIRVTGSDSLLMSSMITNTDEDTQELSDLLFNKADLSTSSSNTTSANSAKYTAVKTVATDLKNVISGLSSTDISAIFAEAEKDKDADTSSVTDQVKDFVSKYNTLTKQLTALGDDKSKAYLADLSSIVDKSADALKAIGIEENSDGTLSIDTEKLAAADATSLTSLFQGDSSFAGLVGEKSVYIGASAAANQYLAGTSNYSSSGSTTDYAQLSSLIGSYMDSLS